jgi:hypothetical protein
MMRRAYFVCLLFIVLMGAGCAPQSIDVDITNIEKLEETTGEEVESTIDSEMDEEERENVEGTEVEGLEESKEDSTADSEEIAKEEVIEEPQFISPYTFTYPDAVRGVYITGHTAGGGNKFNRILELMNTTELNAMVIDIKDDFGYLTYRPDEESPYYEFSQRYIRDIQALLKTLEENEVYPIARIVVFKDSVLAKEKPEWSFIDNGVVWKNGRKESFVNPFLPEVWEYNVGIAKMAAELGFKEIQFDYVRFPEGFERRDKQLVYSMGNYKPEEVKDKDGNVIGENLVKPRVDAVTDFVAYAKKELSWYNIDVSVDIFGYTATLPEAPGIGQNFLRISENVDVISSMIYPSHWTSYFGIAKPDTEPYRLVQEYAKVENEKLSELENPPTSRPWIQDFTASWLGRGNYIKYGSKEIEAQIRALNEAGIWEYLIWNANNNYTSGVNHIPIGKRPE